MLLTSGMTVLSVDCLHVLKNRQPSFIWNFLYSRQTTAGPVHTLTVNKCTVETYFFIRIRHNLQISQKFLRSKKLKASMGLCVLDVLANCPPSPASHSYCCMQATPDQLVTVVSEWFSDIQYKHFTQI